MAFRSLVVVVLPLSQQFASMPAGSSTPMPQETFFCPIGSSMVEAAMVEQMMTSSLSVQAQMPVTILT